MSCPVIHKDSDWLVRQILDHQVPVGISVHIAGYESIRDGRSPHQESSGLEGPEPQANFLSETAAFGMERPGAGEIRLVVAVEIGGDPRRQRGGRLGCCRGPRECSSPKEQDKRTPRKNPPACTEATHDAIPYYSGIGGANVESTGGC